MDSVVIQPGDRLSGKKAWSWAEVRWNCSCVQCWLLSTVILFFVLFYGCIKSWFYSWEGQDIFLFSKTSGTAVWLTQSSVHCIPGTFLGHWSDYSPVSGTEVVNVWSYTLTSYALLACRRTPFWHKLLEAPECHWLNHLLSFCSTYTVTSVR